MIPNAYRLAARLNRIRSVVRKGISYGLGCGGNDPTAGTPADKKLQCDCSGFLAWGFILGRKPKLSRPFWIETSAIYRDATSSKPRTFVRIERPLIGCGVVYPDRNGGQGHCAFVTDVTFDPTGRPKTLKGIDCASGPSRSTGEAINERDISFFLKADPIFFLLKEDFV